MNKGNGKKVTIDQLAIMINRRFDDSERSSDERFRLIISRFEHIEADIADIKRTLGPLLKIIAEQERGVDELRLRVDRLEEKLGLKK